MATDDNTNSTSDAYEIIAAKPEVESLEVDGRELKFRNNGMMRVSDRGLAMAIRDQHGRGKMPNITVTKVKYPHQSDRGHRYFFTVPELPWKR